MSRYIVSDTDIAGQLSYLDGLISRGIRTDLSSVRAALLLLEHPERKVPSVLVGGTNGKGSTVAMIGNIIRHAEYSVGCYYSPHISDVRERLEFNGRPISPADMACLIGRTRKRTEERIELTYFEFLTVSAYLWFSEKKADLSVMEVGMGGRFDATNVTNPVVSVITTVDLDHTHYLGDTREAIAVEKMQIVPRGGSLVAGRVSEGVSVVLSDYAREMEAEVIFLGRDFEGVRQTGGDPEAMSCMRYRGPSLAFDDIRIPLQGSHQVDNAAVAVAVIEVLSRKGFTIPERAIRQGIASVRIQGRIEKVLERPEVLVDVAHNPAGARALADHIRELPKKETTFVVGMMADKDVGGFLREIERTADILILTQPRVGRAATLQTLRDALDSRKGQIHAVRGVGAAVDLALSAVGADGRVVITGSFHTVQEAIEHIHGRP